MEPMPIMRTNFHRGSHKKVVSQGRHETHFPDASIPPNETHRNYASHDFYGTRKMYANRWGCGNHSKNVNHILDVTHNAYVSHPTYGTHAWNASWNRNEIHDRYASHCGYGTHGRDANQCWHGALQTRCEPWIRWNPTIWCESKRGCNPCFIYEPSFWWNP